MTASDGYALLVETTLASSIAVLMASDSEYPTKARARAMSATTWACARPCFRITVIGAGSVRAIPRATRRVVASAEYTTTSTPSNVAPRRGRIRSTSAARPTKVLYPLMTSVFRADGGAGGASDNDMPPAFGITGRCRPRKPNSRASR